MSAPYRVLVTGSRTWTDRDAVFEALHEVRDAIPPERLMMVVHGACPTGADQWASQWASGETLQTGWRAEERHPAKWHDGGRFNRAAGFRRNAEMVAAGADLALAFIRDNSAGATHCASLAEKAGIPVRYWRAP